jgi:hypothetical protein
LKKIEVVFHFEKIEVIFHFEKIQVVFHLRRPRIVWLWLRASQRLTFPGGGWVVGGIGTKVSPSI